MLLLLVVDDDNVIFVVVALTHNRHACGSAPIQLVSLDLMPGWRPFVEAMDMHFGVYDIEDRTTPLLAKAEEVTGPGFPADGVTYVIISYVMIYVSTDAVCDMLRDLLSSGQAYCILVSERGEVTAAVGMMERRRVQVHRLIDQTKGVDERQTVWLSSQTVLKPPAQEIATIFPNVPFEEKKDRRQVLEKGPR